MYRKGSSDKDSYKAKEKQENIWRGKGRGENEEKLEVNAKVSGYLPTSTDLAAPEVGPRNLCPPGILRQDNIW